MPSPQWPLNTGYGSATAAAQVAEVVDLRGEVAIVTGGYSGLGLETAPAQALMQLGAQMTGARLD